MKVLQGIVHQPAHGELNGTTSETRGQGGWRRWFGDARGLVSSIFVGTTSELRGQGLMSLRGACDEIKVCSSLANLCSLVWNRVALDKVSTPPPPPPAAAAAESRSAAYHCRVVGLNSLSLPLSLHSVVAGWRRPSANAITLTSCTFNPSSFATPVSSSSSASPSSAAVRPSGATARLARYVDDRWQRPTRRRQPRL